MCAGTSSRHCYCADTDNCHCGWSSGRNCSQRLDPWDTEAKERAHVWRCTMVGWDRRGNRHRACLVMATTTALSQEAQKLMRQDILMMQHGGIRLKGKQTTTRVCTHADCSQQGEQHWEEWGGLCGLYNHTKVHLQQHTLLSWRLPRPRRCTLYIAGI